MAPPKPPPPTPDMARAEWLQPAVAAIARRAALPGPFAADEALRDMPPPGHPNWFGLAVMIASRERIIVQVGTAVSARKPRHHGLNRLWLGRRWTATSREAA